MRVLTGRCVLAESLGFGWGLLGCWILVGPSLCCLLGCLVVVWCWGVGVSGYLGGVCVAVLLRSGAVLALWCGLGSGAVLVEVCGVLHVFGGVVVGGWWCSVEPVPGQSGRAMNLGRGL